MTDPRRIEILSRAHMIECIMAVVGRSQPDPVKFRRWLEMVEDARLRDVFRHLCGEAEDKTI